MKIEGYHTAIVRCEPVGPYQVGADLAALAEKRVTGGAVLLEQDMAVIGVAAPAAIGAMAATSI